MGGVRWGGRGRLAVVVATAAALLGSATQAQADQVINDDLIVIGSQCVGLECINNEVFDFDAFRLKEDNVRIHVLDTSSSTGYPSNDWRLVFNDTSSGGQNYFGVQDATSGRMSFRVDAGAPSDALRVAPSGNVGLGTGSPAKNLSIFASDTPTIRLDQQGGFGEYVWDVLGNEANWAIRDVMNGNSLPLRVRPGVATNGLDLDTSGVQVRGALQQNTKPGDLENEQPVDSAAVMTGLRDLVLTTNEYKADPNSQLHLLPAADRFKVAFGLGSDNFVSPTDMAGVALVAAKVLDERVAALEGGSGTPGPPGPQGPAGPAGGAGSGEEIAALQKTARKQGKRIKKLKRANRKLAKRMKAIERSLGG